MRMEGLKVVLAMVAFSVLQLVQSQDQQGFISLDCGLPPNQSPYTEPTTGLIFTSDADFIQTGTRGRIGNEWYYTYKQYNALRYFPDGIRNCYNLIVKQGVKYLIRAGFAYDNYDGRNKYPRFDIYIGTNLWKSVYVQNKKDFEIIHMAKSNSLQICLVKTGTDAPMISTLELRPVRNDSYMTQFGSLNLVYRWFFKDTFRFFLSLRYPDDVYDRQWSEYYMYDGEKEINTTLAVNSSNPFALPEVVARSAMTHENATEPLFLYEYPANPSDDVVIYLHFAEVQDLGANETREFDIVWDDNITIPAYRPKMLQVDTIFNALPKKCEYGSCDLQLVRTPRSTLAPLVNAYEVYEVMEFPYSETYPPDVAAMKSIETAYGLKINSWQGDPCLPEQWKWKGVDCNYTDKSTPRIISLELPSKGLHGIISPTLQNLTHLQNLDLSNNTLSGGVPEFLATMKSLSIINLSFNRLKGRVPQSLREKKGLQLLIQGNPDLCMDDSCKTETTKILVPIIASVAALVLIIALLVIFFVFKKKKTLKGRSQQPIKASILTKKRRFTYPELEAITNNFENIIGEGGFGIVYRGSLGDNEQVAVKVLSQSSTQGYNQFKAEVELLLRVHHVKLVSFVGYCFEEGHLALVYEYTTHGDLKQHLSGERSGPALSWASRLNIAADIAQALEYLHTGCRPAMVHRDVKSPNILIDEHFHAKLVDFGLSRSFAVGVETQMTTIVAGTPGYLDPEYNQTHWLTEKSDVYSFGIVLLELITNRPVIEPGREKPHIAEWVRFMLTKEGIEQIVDPSLVGDYEARSMWKVVELAISCVNPSSAGRPIMSHVVNELKECVLLVSENSKEIGTTTEVDSKSSFDQSMGFAGEITPAAR